jgi:hypothetical protein
MPRVRVLAVFDPRLRGRIVIHSERRGAEGVLAAAPESAGGRWRFRIPAPHRPVSRTVVAQAYRDVPRSCATYEGEPVIDRPQTGWKAWQAGS